MIHTIHTSRNWLYVLLEMSLAEINKKLAGEMKSCDIEKYETVPALIDNRFLVANPQSIPLLPHHPILQFLFCCWLLLIAFILLLYLTTTTVVLSMVRHYADKTPKFITDLWCFYII